MDVLKLSIKYVFFTYKELCSFPQLFLESHYALGVFLFYIFW